MNEGIFTSSASKQRKIFSQVTKAKKEIFKNASDTKPAVKEEKQMPSFQQLRTSLEEKTLTPAEKTKREEIAKAMERETPGMPMAKKMAIATAQAKKVAEGTEVNEAVSVKKEKHSWGTMMTVHHGSDTSYPLHPEHQSAIKKLRPGMKTTFKDETNSTVHAHREGDTVHLTRPKTGSTLTSLPYHHFDTSEHAKPAAKKPAGVYDRKVTDHLKKKYNEEIVSEADNPCWDGYKMLGMKNKDGKQVPNCIPEESHYCAKHVYSNMFGEGTVVEGIHADPDEQGNVEWYAVQFNEGIKKVFTEKLEIMMAEYHGNHNKKKPKR